MKDYLKKKPDGSYSLTPDGEQELLYLTARKLVLYYLQNNLKKEKSEIAPVNEKLQGYIYTNFNSLPDFTQKLNDLSAFIGNSDHPQFQKFMGQYFLSTYNKEKTAFIERELKANRERYDNPNYVPSMTLLKLYGDLFLSAKQLNKKSETKPQTATTPIEQMIETAQVIEIEPEQMPGILLLKSLKPYFDKSQPLGKIRSTISVENPDEKTVSTATVNPQQYDISTKPMPGEKFLQLYKNTFVGLPVLNLNGNNHNTNRYKLGTKSMVTIKTCARVINNVSTFAKNRDQDGYRAWYEQQPKLLKILIKINSLINSEKKGTIIDWDFQLKVLASRNGIEKKVVEQLFGELQLYLVILNSVKEKMGALRNLGVEAAELGRIYNQSINVLSETYTRENAKAALLMILMQVSLPEGKQTLESEFNHILENYY